MKRGAWIICGGRHYSKADRVFQILDAAVERLGLAFLIEGGCESGADKLAREWREARGVPGKSFPANWRDVSSPHALIREDRFGRRYNVLAGPWRNRQMIDEGAPEGVIAFRGGDGTHDMLARAERAEIRTIRIDWE
ncbi:SLOG family protein [Pararhizobium haloflavum]|uniref:SLOG family protein n=1 Tax=Pararhizobium haloflavum TaxID=2037914 RepID=UPI000C1A11F0|nr:SLOG family protein [Pararhizobium haloflavum]